MKKRQHGSAVRKAKPSVWTEFITLAAENNAVNLGQGFPNEPMPQFLADILKDVASHPERTDWHQYTRDLGHPRLVNILAKIYSHFYGREVNPKEEILITVGACLALDYSFRGWISKGDEVILIEPCYDCYAPQIEMAGGTPISCPMILKEHPTSSEDYIVDLKDLEAKCNGNTKMLVINNPNNPTGKLFSREELEGIAGIAKKFDLIVIADEVYEWHQMDKEMVRFASLPGAFERTISIGSAGKAFSITGWKLGWAIGPAELLEPLKMVHQNCVFTCSSPTQEAVARAFEIEHPMIVANSKDPKSYLLSQLPKELIDKREKLSRMLQEAGLTPLMPEAGYFMLADFTGKDGPFRDENSDSGPIDFRFVRWLCKEKKLAAIPPSAFYFDEEQRPNIELVRLCFMKKEETLEAAKFVLKEL